MHVCTGSRTGRILYVGSCCTVLPRLRNSAPGDSPLLGFFLYLWGLFHLFLLPHHPCCRDQAMIPVVVWVLVQSSSDICRYGASIFHLQRGMPITSVLRSSSNSVHESLQMDRSVCRAELLPPSFDDPHERVLLALPRPICRRSASKPKVQGLDPGHIAIPWIIRPR